MKTTLYEKVKKFVNESRAGRYITHFERTVHWIKILKPDADEALLIAAYSHDIERAFRGFKGSLVESEEILKKHQGEGGKIMYDFILKNGGSKILAERVRELISKHEVGGTHDQNVLKDADSISYLEVNAPRHILEREKRGWSEEELMNKWDYMYNRITLPQAKHIAKRFYEKAMSDLQ